MRRLDAVDARNWVKDDPTMSLVIGGFRHQLNGAEVNEGSIARPMNRGVIHDVLIISGLDMNVEADGA
jgi:hypothetical protein